MLRALLVILGAAVTLAMLVALLVRGERRYADDASGSLVLYCAASNAAVIEQIRSDYEARFQQSIEIQYGASQTLLSSLEISRSGDLYLPADDSYLEIADHKNLIAQTVPVAQMQAVLAIRKGNPKRIHSLQDLSRPDVRFVQASPDSAAIGKVSRAALAKLGRWAEIEAATTAFRATVNEVANDVEVGAADVGIVYDAVLHSYPRLTALAVPELAGAVSQVSIGVLSTSSRPAAAGRFASYLSAVDGGQRRYAQHGFRILSDREPPP